MGYSALQVAALPAVVLHAPVAETASQAATLSAVAQLAAAVAAEAASQSRALQPALCSALLLAEAQRSALRAVAEALWSLPRRVHASAAEAAQLVVVVAEVPLPAVAVLEPEVLQAVQAAEAVQAAKAL